MAHLKSMARSSLARAVAIGVGLLGLMVGLAPAAFAQGYVQGQTSGVTVYGISYRMFSYMNTTTGQPAKAGTVAYTSSSQEVPIGYIGIRPMMFFADGVVCREASGFAYNGTSTNSFNNAIGPGCGAGPAYYSRGDVQYYNGNGYDTYPTFRTANDPSVAIGLIPTKVNSRGQTYGSAMSGVLPDLIAVRATNGQIGYITRSAFLGPELTLQQVRALPRGPKGNLIERSQLAPVFASNGTTAIGVFG